MKIGINSDTFPVEREVEEYQEKIIRAGRSIQTSYSSLEETQKELDEAAYRTERLETLRERIQVMEQKVKAAVQEMEELSTARESIRKKIDELRRATAMLPEAIDFNDEVASLRGEEKDLTERLEDAEESRIGAAQVLDILQSELKSLQLHSSPFDDQKAFLKRMSRLKANTGDQIRAYIQLEERLTEKMYKRALLKLKQKGNDWMKSIRDNYNY